MRSAVGREEGYLIRVTLFECLGHAVSDFRVHAHDLPDGWGIDGLIGLNFLRRLNYEIRSIEGLIMAAPVARQGRATRDQCTISVTSAAASGAKTTE